MVAIEIAMIATVVAAVITTVPPVVAALFNTVAIAVEGATLVFLWCVFFCSCRKIVPAFCCSMRRQADGASSQNGGDESG